jgi:hypothetical protein
MSFNLSETLENIAPTLGRLVKGAGTGFLLGGPAGAVTGLGGAAVREIAEALSVPTDGKQEDIVAAVTTRVRDGLTSEDIVKIKTAELAFNERMASQKIELFKTEVSDAANARSYGMSSPDNSARQFKLAISILATFMLATIGLGWLIYDILTEGLKIKGEGTIAAVFGLIGTAYGYVAANAQQVIGFYFGSSQSSKDHGDAVRIALAKTTAALEHRGP